MKVKFVIFGLLLVAAGARAHAESVTTNDTIARYHVLTEQCFVRSTTEAVFSYRDSSAAQVALAHNVNSARLKARCRGTVGETAPMGSRYDLANRLVSVGICFDGASPAQMTPYTIMTQGIYQARPQVFYPAATEDEESGTRILTAKCSAAGGVLGKPHLLSDIQPIKSNGRLWDVHENDEAVLFAPCLYF
jgi:hypothetical protein